MGQRRSLGTLPPCRRDGSVSSQGRRQGRGHSCPLVRGSRPTLHVHRTDLGRTSLLEGTCRGSPRSTAFKERATPTLSTEALAPSAWSEWPALPSRMPRGDPEPAPRASGDSDAHIWGPSVRGSCNNQGRVAGAGTATNKSRSPNSLQCLVLQSCLGAHAPLPRRRRARGSIKGWWLFTHQEWDWVAQEQESPATPRRHWTEV